MPVYGPASIVLWVIGARLVKAAVLEDAMNISALDPCSCIRTSEALMRMLLL
jgi:hypothetical protein